MGSEKCIRDLLKDMPHDAKAGDYVIMDDYEVIILWEPYDGSRKPVYSNGRGRKRIIGYIPVYGKKKRCSIPYDSDVWPLVYGRSEEELVEQARTVLDDLKGGQ